MIVAVIVIQDADGSIEVHHGSRVVYCVLCRDSYSVYGQYTVEDVISCVKDVRCERKEYLCM